MQEEHLEERCTGNSFGIPPPRPSAMRPGLPAEFDSTAVAYRSAGFLAMARVCSAVVEAGGVSPCAATTGSMAMRSIRAAMVAAIGPGRRARPETAVLRGGVAVRVHVTTKRVDKDPFPVADIARDMWQGLLDFTHDEAIRDQPDFDRLRALIADEWEIGILSGGQGLGKVAFQQLISSLMGR